ncbi:MAG: hypothetical protein ABH837_00675, partial [bacterium]
KTVDLLEKSRSYASNPRTQDFRPIYYLTSFTKEGESGGETDIKIDTLDLDVFMDTNNDDIGDQRQNIETHKLEDDNEIYIRFNSVTFFEGLKNIIKGDEDYDDLVTCDTGFFSIGFKVGNPNQILARCNQGPTPGSPVLTFSDALLPVRFASSDLHSEIPNNERIFVWISNYGQKIQVCKGVIDDNPDNDQCS